MKKILILSTIFSFTLTSVAFSANSKVVASVNGEKIYDSEIKRNLNQIPNYDSLSIEQQKEIKGKIITAVSKLRAVIQEARRLNVHESKDFKEKLQDFKDQLMYTTLLEQHIKSFITEKKLRDYYKKNKSKYLQTKANAGHILVEKRAQAEEIIQKLNAGEDFTALAKEHSVGPSANDGGNLGWFNKDEMVKEFSEATFALKEGKYTKKPVQTQFGWHVIYLKEKMEDVAILFDDVKDQIEEELAEKEIQKYLSTILDEAEIVTNENN